MRRTILHRFPTTLLVAVLAISAAACGETTISVETPEPEPPPDTIDLERGLVAYYRFDETEPGSEVLDASGNGHAGTPTDPPPTPSTSVPPVGFANPRSLAFDGAEQLVDLGNPDGLNLSGNITVSAWIRPLALDGQRNIVAHGFRWDPKQELVLRITESTYVFNAWDGVDHWVTALVPPGDIDNWHHLAGVYESGTYRLYRDGELVAERRDAFAPRQVDAPWAIGGRSATTPPESRYFSGLIDEVRIYARALSADEVRALFRR
jgi:hypothetical protein